MVLPLKWESGQIPNVLNIKQTDNKKKSNSDLNPP